MADPADLAALQSTKAEVSAMVALLLAGIKESTNTPSAETPLKHNPLAVLSTASTLLRAQATHLGLLAITPPFTPTALTSTLRTTIKLLPAFAAALEDARHPRIPRCVEREARTRARSLLDAVRSFVAAVPRNAEAQREAQSEASGEQRVLRGTGIVWEGCDWFIEVGEKGSRLVALTKLQAWEGLVDDAAEEIDEWLAMEQDGNESESDEEEEDDFFGDSKACPPELEPLARNVQMHINHLQRLFQALQHDVDRIPQAKQARPEDLPDVETAHRLDKALDLAADASHEVDELVATLYAGDKEVVRKELARARESIWTQATAILGAEHDWVTKWKELK